jgi:uncharacterized protein YbbC (DUF1343 family)
VRTISNIFVWSILRRSHDEVDPPPGENPRTRRRKTASRAAAIALAAIFIPCGCGNSGHILRRPRVKTGLDVLIESRYRPLKGRRVGLICNHSTVSSEGEHAISLFQQQDVFELKALFSPEHGLQGKVEEKIPSGVDEESGLKIYSLYGETLRPTEESLKEIDTLVFDVQDIGARFYTYITTLAMCMEEAAKHNVRFVVLDRPNPIRGTDVQGPVLDDEYVGRFVSYKPLPLTHGMTIGELARMYNREFDVRCDLEVVKMRGWRRRMWFDETSLPWIDPSPNIRNLVEAILYPGFCIVERTNLSVGRGTFAPFELYGAPWINGEKLAKEMNSLHLPGLQFVPAEFTPDKSVFAGERCSGVRVVLTDRNKLDGVRTGLSFADAIYRLHGDSFEIDRIGPMVGDPAVAKKIKAGVPVETIIRQWRPRLKHFMNRRKRYLLYP